MAYILHVIQLSWKIQNAMQVEGPGTKITSLVIDPLNPTHITAPHILNLRFPIEQVDSKLHLISFYRF